MNNVSVFLFDDREQFFYGEITRLQEAPLDQTTYEALKESRKKTKQYFKVLASTVLSSVLYIGLPLTCTGATAANVQTKRILSHWDFSDSDLKSDFTDSRKFLGLTQEQAAKILGLSVSTVEKIEQGVYENISKPSREHLGRFIEWASLLRDNHRNKKFVVRAIINSKMELLGDKSPIDYALSNPGAGIRELIALQHQTHG